MNNLTTRSVQITYSYSTELFSITPLIMINESEHLNLSETAKLLLNNLKPYTPQKNDRLFILPGCTIPRFKLKTFCEKEKVALVKYSDRANIIITSSTVIEKDLMSTSGCRSTSDMIDFINKYGTPQLIQLLPEIIQHNPTSICFDWLIEKKFDEMSGNRCPEKTSYHNKFAFTSDEAFMKYVNAVKAGNVYNENCILSKLNSGNIMNDTEYESIKRLLESSDAQNVKLAIEIISNCDFQLSAVNILLLLMEFGNPISNSPTKQHVNFKSLLKFFNLTQHSFTRLNYDDIVEILLNKSLLNQNNLNKMYPRLVTAAEDRLNSDYLKFNGFILSDKIKEGLKNNILDYTHDTTILRDEDFEVINPHIN